MKLAPLRNLAPRRLALHDALWGGLWLATVAALEVVGRASPHEVSDLVGVATLAALALLTWREHRRRPLAWVGALAPAARRVARLLGALELRTGVDLRGTPPLPAGLPGVQAAGLLLLALVDAALLAAAAHLPTNARGGLLELSPTLTFAVQAVAWPVLAVGGLLGLGQPGVLGHQALLASPRGTPAERRQRATLFGGLYVLGTGACVLLLPGYVPWILAALLLGILAALLPFARRAPLDLLWSSGSASPRAMHWTTQLGVQAALFGGALLAAFLATQGERYGLRPGAAVPADGADLPAAAPSLVPITTALGTVFGWGGVGLAGLLLFDAARLTWLARRRDPAAPRRPRVHVAGADLAGCRERVRGVLRRAGFDVAFEPAPREPTDVPVRLAPQGGQPTGGPAADEGPGAWPLRAAEADLARPAVHELLRRRHAVLCRRRLVRGLRRMFRAARRSGVGTGLFVAPHLWFETRLSRDVDEEDELLPGPPYHPTVPLAARAHFAEVLRGAEVDLVFVEDGVSFRRFEHVLRTLFEYHDLFGGERPAEERQFTGLPGVRVVLHAFDLPESTLPTGYPEPDYEDIGRARILHVFLDRGGDSTPDLVPSTNRGHDLPVVLA